MKNYLVLFLTLTLIACGPSQGEKEKIAAVTCSIMGASRNMDGAIRVREMNAAREKIGGEPFLRGDAVIKEAFEYGLCEELVLNAAYDESLGVLKDAERERERIATEKERIYEQERKQRVIGPLQEWKSAIVTRINTVSNPLMDIKVTGSDSSTLEFWYKCSGFHHMDTKFIVTFANELGTLNGENSFGICIMGHSENYLYIDMDETDMDNLYKVIGNRDVESLLSSVKSVDVEIRGTRPYSVTTNTTSQRSPYRYVDPGNFHESLMQSDLSDDPIRLRIYEK